ncbi:ORF42 (plastid) [Oryza sativa Japonica Group]|uniref:Ribosomal protein L23 n=2 Tax=Oryza TaxID=4527 RepID=A0A0H3V9Q7_9ORYZ|nr:ORF42 [Oryza sativa Japonica Group]YP_009155632.1 ribosomal protein L23 [Oryza glumipatula]YP_009155715.1 ribosomal protein L23 [Oryza longistaminata]QZR91826.1 ribosomal protein L23 [Oryza glaberrima]prf//1603356AL rpl23-like ORF 44 [Oryza sativa]AJP34124.1 ribosomal protein L23 [Oryza glumipatula]AJP34207.1 ribosomal protein L23 [Oryza longistaminata]AJP34290.1 ribosomal protein L23 [Oryza longistaminata]|eukprot:NP_039392.1 ORF42 [Oryza sativa Japonica Group]
MESNTQYLQKKFSFIGKESMTYNALQTYDHYPLTGLFYSTSR